MLSSVLVIMPFLGVISAANNWSTPCVKGQCSYDLPATNGPSSGTMKIWGSEDAITDITTAADWQILGCDPKALSQNIRLVCMNDSDDPNSLCGHLYQNTGAVNKIVRLPENCGANAFARVSKAWVPDDQSIPASITARLVRRDGKPPVVKALAIDTDFDQVDWQKNGKVNIAIQAANIPGAATDIEIPGSRRVRRGSPSRFNIGGIIDGIGNKITSVAGEVAGEATSLAGDATSVLGDAGSAVTSALGSVVTDIASHLSGGLNKTVTLDPVTFDKSVNLFNTSTDCGPVSAKLSVDLDANANAQPTLTVAVQGTLSPFALAKFEAVAGMTTQVQGTLTVGAELSGHVDSGQIPLFNAGIPGFDFPGLLTVGPSFQVNAQFVGDVDIQLDMTVGINFDVNNAQLSFPPDDSNKPDSNAFSIGDTPLSLSASPSVTATGTLTAHLIPSLNIGLTVLGGKAANANIFLALDTSAALILNLDASAQITQPIAGTNSTTDGTATNSTTDGTATDSTTDAKTTDGTIEATSTDSGADATATSDADVGFVAPTKRDDPTVSTAFGGCVQVQGGIDVNAGAQGEFFHLFDDLVSVPLFSKKFEIFKKCFSDGATTAPAVTRRRMRRVSAPQSVTEGTVSSSSIPEL
ncbi:hypothetical protein FB451DRAFT_1448692 [Mycena latifolia]|nr:hypothetical protein FB451DRAFT_1448692 [Mycena latifolia]